MTNVQRTTTSTRADSGKKSTEIVSRRRRRRRRRGVFFGVSVHPHGSGVCGAFSSRWVV